MELIQIIHEELLKSAELTGIWEKKLREIERRTYNAGQFLEELKQMVSEVVMSVLSDNSNRHITIQAPAPEKAVRLLPRQRLPISRKRSRRKEHRESLPPQVKRRSRLRALWQLQVRRLPYKLTISSVSLVALRKRYRYQGENGLRLF